jgi:hypothetical protein
MATVEEYASGKILRSIRFAHLALLFSGVPLVGPVINKNLELRMEPFDIRPITLREAGRVIEESVHCAAGLRVCQPLFPDAMATESVFLNDLADRMVEAGMARMVTKDAALSILEKYPGNPLVLSRVSGRYLEICRSVPEVCIFWNMRRKGMHV